MDQSNSLENLHYPMSGGNVRNLARLFEDNTVSRKPNFTLTKSKSKSYSNIIIKKEEITEFDENETLTFRDIHSKFESGRASNKSLHRLPSITNLECLKLQEIKEISARADEIAKKFKTNERMSSGFYMIYLNEIVDLLLKIGQIDTFGNASIQTEKLSTLQILQKCYSQLRAKLEGFLGDDNSEEEEQKLSIRSSIQRWESMIESKPQYVVPNYSIHYSNGPKRNDKNDYEKGNVEIIKSGDNEDDLKVVEHVKVQNLKDIWERRGSEDKKNDYQEENRIDTQILEDEQPQIIECFTGYYKENEIKIQPQTPKFEIEQEEINPQKEEENQIFPEDTKFDINQQEAEEQIKEEIETTQLEIKDESQFVPKEDNFLVKIDENEKIKDINLEEENKKLNDTQREFLKEERKHTEDTFFEETVPENNITIEYVNEESSQELEIKSKEEIESKEEEIELKEEIVEVPVETPQIEIKEESKIVPEENLLIKIEETEIVEKINQKETQKSIEDQLDFLGEEKKHTEDTFNAEALPENGAIEDTKEEPSQQQEIESKNEQIETENEKNQIEVNEGSKIFPEGKTEDNLLIKIEETETVKEINQEETQKSIEDQLDFLEEEKKHTEETFNEESIPENVTIEDTKEESSQQQEIESKEEQIKIEEVNQEEETQKSIEDQLNFLKEEKKHTEDTFYEEQVPESNITIEYIKKEPSQQQEVESKEEIEVQVENKPKIEEENKKLIEAQQDFLKEEIKHTEETFYEKPISDNNITIEYIKEESSQQQEIEPREQIEVQIENKLQIEDDKKIEETNPEEENKKLIEAQQNFLKEEIKHTEETKQTVFEETQNEEDEDDDEFVKPRTQNLTKTSKTEDFKPKTKEFLDEERKNTDLQLEEIDPKFGPPTGIIPDPTKNYERIQVIETDEKPADDQFIIIYEKADDEQKINLEEEEFVKRDVQRGDVQRIIVQETSHREGNYLILDNSPVEEINQGSSSKEENILVNGDKM